MKYSPFKKGKLKKSGVSDIIGNLLILAITVTLFSGVLFYVNSMPGPQNQTYADFSYEITPGVSSTIINVTKSGGETLENSGIAIALIVNDVNTVLTISEGGVGDTWDLGETWSYKYNGVLDSEDTVEMMIIDNVENNVVWDNILLGSGSSVTFAPVITDRGLTTSPVYVKDTVYFYCKVVDLDGDLLPSSVKVDLSGLTPAPSVTSFSMTYSSVSGYYISDAGLELTATDGIPNWNGDTVLFQASDAEGNTVQSAYTLTIYKESGGQEQYGPYWDWTSYIVNGTYPSDASGGESSSVGTTFYYIRNAATGTITDQFVAGDKVLIEVYSTALRNLALENSFYIYMPITGLAISPQSSTSAFIYNGIYGTFYSYSYNFTVPSQSYVYPIQFKLKDNSGTVVNVADTINVGGGTYPELLTYKYITSTSMVKTSSYNHTDTLYLQIKTKDVDLSAGTVYISDIQISDYSGRYIIKKSPASYTYTSTPSYTASSKPVSSVFKASTTSPASNYNNSNSGYYTVYIVLKDAYQGWWLPGTNAYTVKITMVSDSGTGATTGEVYYNINTQINVTAPLTTTDILASVGSGSFTWSASGASWSDSKIAWYSGGEQWDETIIDDTPNDGPIGLVLADIDGDGDDDVVVGCQDADYANIVWYENQKSDGSTWSSARPVAMPFDALAGTQEAGTSSTSNTNEDVSVYKTYGSDTFYPNGGEYVCTYELCAAISVGDFDGDGDGDIVASYLHVVVISSAGVFNDADYSNSFGMYFNRGVYVFWNDGSWTKTTLYGTNDWIAANTANADSNPAALGIDTGDFNGDGCDDIAAVYETGTTSVWVSRYADTTGSVSTRENAAFGTSSSLKTTVPSVAGNTPWSHKMYAPCVQIEDMNNDAIPDIVRSSSNDNSVTIFYTQASYPTSSVYAPDVEFSLKSDPSKVTGSRTNLNGTADSSFEVLTETYTNYTPVNAVVSAKDATYDTTGEPITDLEASDSTYYSVANTKVMYLNSFTLDSSKGTIISAAKLVVKYTVASGYAGTSVIYVSNNDGSTYTATTIQPVVGTNVVTFNLLTLGIDTYAELSNLDVMFTNSDAIPVEFDYVFVNVTFVETRTLAREWSIPNLMREYHNFTITAAVSAAVPAEDGFKLEYSVDNSTWFFLTYINSTTLTTYQFSLTYTTNSHYYFRLNDTNRATSDLYNDTISIDVMTVRHYARTVSWDSTNKYSSVIPVGSGEYVTALAVGDMGRTSSDYTADGLNDIVVGTSKIGTGYATNTLYQMTQISSTNFQTYSIYTTTMCIMCTDNSLYDVKNIALGDTDGDGDLDIIVVIGASFGRDPGTGPTLWVYENNNLGPSGTAWQYGEDYVNILASKGESAINVQTGNIDLTIFLPVIGLVGVVVTEGVLRRVEKKKKP